MQNNKKAEAHRQQVTWIAAYTIHSNMFIHIAYCCVNEWLNMIINHMNIQQVTACIIVVVIYWSWLKLVCEIQ